MPSLPSLLAGNFSARSGGRNSKGYRGSVSTAPHQAAAVAGLLESSRGAGGEDRRVIGQGSGGSGAAKVAHALCPLERKRGPDSNTGANPVGTKPCPSGSLDC